MDLSYTRRALLASGAFVALSGAGCLGTPEREEPERSDRSLRNDTDDSSTSRDDSSDDESPTKDRVPEAALFDDFEDLTDWEAIDGSLVADEESYLVGSQSARIDVEDGHARAAIRRSFDEPRDFTAVHPILAMQSEDTVYPRIRFIDGEGDQLECRAGIRSTVDFQPFDFSISSVEGDPDLSSIHEVQITQYIGSNESTRMWLDAFHLAERQERGVIMIHFDDALRTDYSVALPLLSEHGMAASTFINPGYLDRTVGGSERLSTEEVEALADAGWDIGSHGMNHNNLAEADPDQLRSEIHDAHDWLSDHGFGSTAKYFVYPYSAYDQPAIDVVSDVHEVAFAGGWGGHGPPGNPALVPRALGDPSFETARDEVDRTAAYDGLTSIFYHELANENLASFERLVDYLASMESSGDIAVKTVSETDVGGAYRGLSLG